MKKIALPLLAGIIALSSCKKVVEVKDLDKQINLSFLTGYIGTSSSAFDNDYNQCVLKDFDKRDYKHIDSITFNIGLSVGAPNDTAYARLYNITDQVEIANSLVKSNGKQGYIEFHSNDILASLPEKRVNLGVQIRSSGPGRYAFASMAYLKLRRN